MNRIATVVARPKVLLLLFAATLGAFAFLLAFSTDQPTSEAYDATGGVNSGNGNCSISYSSVKWDYVDTWEQFKSHYTDSSNCYNPGSTRSDLARSRAFWNDIGAVECWDRRTEAVGWFYLAYNNQWFAWPSNNHAKTSKASAKSGIDAQTVTASGTRAHNADTMPLVRAAAKSALKANNNIVVCVFPEDTIWRVNPAKPTYEAPTCTYRWGRIHFSKTVYNQTWMGNYYRVAAGYNRHSGAATIAHMPSGSYYEPNSTTTLWFIQRAKSQLTNSTYGDSANVRYAYKAGVNDTADRGRIYGPNHTEALFDITPRFKPDSECTPTVTTTQAPTPTIEQNTGYDCAGNEYFIGGASVTVPTKAGVQYYMDGHDIPAGVYYLGSGQRFTIAARTAEGSTLALTGTTSWTFDAMPTGAASDCSYTVDYPESTTTEELICRDVRTGEDETPWAVTTEVGTYPYHWRTTLTDGLSAGVRPAGTKPVTDQTAEKYTPLGDLFRNSSTVTPREEQITEAVAQANSTQRAVIPALTADNRTAVAQGGVFNLIERTTNINITKTTNGATRTPWEYCDVYAQVAERTRTISYTVTASAPVITMQPLYYVDKPTIYNYQSFRWYAERSSTSASWPTPFPDRVNRSGQFTASDTSPPNNGVTGIQSGNLTRYHYDFFERPGDRVIGGMHTNNPDFTVPAKKRQHRIRPYGLVHVTGNTCTPRNRTAVAASAPASTYFYRPNFMTHYEGIEYRCWTDNEFTWTVTEDVSPWTEWALEDSWYAGTGDKEYGNPYSVTYGYTTAGTLTTPQTTNLAQILGNHCYTSGLRAAAQSATPHGDPKIKAKFTKDEEEDYSAFFMTETLDPNKPSWGAGGNPITDSTALFDKQCAVNGVQAAGASLQGDSDAVRNFYRSNDLDDGKVTVPLYRPESNAILRDTGADALATIVTRWAEGTPNVNGLNNEGQMRAYGAKKGEKIFAANTENAPTFKNWQTYTNKSGATWGVMTTQENAFKFGGTWASEKGKPNVFQVKWIYAPEVQTTHPYTNLGFGSGGVAMATPGTTNVPVHVQLYGRTDGAKSDAPHDEVMLNTGTGVVNTADGTLLSGVPSAGSAWLNPENSAYNNVVKFNRSVGN